MRIAEGRKYDVIPRLIVSYFLPAIGAAEQIPLYALERVREEGGRRWRDVLAVAAPEEEAFEPLAGGSHAVRSDLGTQ